MKNKKIERNLRLMKLFYRRHPLKLPKDMYCQTDTYTADIQLQQGLYFADASFLAGIQLSSFNRVLFVLNKRHICVDWRHPREIYYGKAYELAFDEADKRGLALSTFYELPEFVAIRQHFLDEGVGCPISPTIKIEHLAWGVRVQLCCPLSILDEASLILLADLAKGLLKREVTLAQVFPDHQYGPADWKAEEVQREQDAQIYERWHLERQASWGL